MRCSHRTKVPITTVNFLKVFQQSVAIHLVHIVPKILLPNVRRKLQQIQQHAPKGKKKSARDITAVQELKWAEKCLDQHYRCVQHHPMSVCLRKSLFSYFVQQPAGGAQSVTSSTNSSGNDSTGRILVKAIANKVRPKQWEINLSILIWCYASI